MRRGGLSGRENVNMGGPLKDWNGFAAWNEVGYSVIRLVDRLLQYLNRYVGFYLFDKYNVDNDDQ